MHSVSKCIPIKVIPQPPGPTSIHILSMAFVQIINSQYFIQVHEISPVPFLQGIDLILILFDLKFFIFMQEI